MGELQDEMKEIKSLLKKQQEEKEDKPKKFRIPFGKKVGKGQKKRNYITLIKLNENRTMDFKKVQIEDQTFMEDDTPRLAPTESVYTYKKNPFIILPSWNVKPITPQENTLEEGEEAKPFSPSENYQNSLLEGSNTVGFRLLMNKMKLSTVQTKKQVGNLFKWIFFGAIGIAIGYAFIAGA